MVEIVADPVDTADNINEGEDLRAKAETLGIKVDGRWSDARLASEIEKASA